MMGCIACKMPLRKNWLWAALSWAKAALQSAPQTKASPALREDINQQAERLLNSYGNSILRYAYTYLHNREDAEEILQETLIRFLQTKPVFANDQHEKAWLLRVAANLSKNKLRAEKIRQTDELNEELAAEQRQDQIGRAHV